MKLPKELFVCARRLGTELRGWLTEHNSNSSLEPKKKQAVLDSCFYRASEENGVWVFTKNHYDESARRYINTVQPIPQEEAPRIWQNDPLTGFRIVDYISTGKSNKKWLVEDPRGLIFEITTRSFAVLLGTCTIDKGLILEPCIWKSSGNLIVAP